MIFIVVREHVHPVTKKWFLSAVETVYDDGNQADQAAQSLARTFKCRAWALQFPDLPMLVVPNVVSLDKFKTVQ